MDGARGHFQWPALPAGGNKFGIAAGTEGRNSHLDGRQLRKAPAEDASDRRRLAPQLHLAGSIHPGVAADRVPGQGNGRPTSAGREIREFIEGYYNTPFETMARSQSVFTGNIQEAIGWLKGFIDAGAQAIVISFGGPGQTDQLELCGKEVPPKLRG